MVYQHLTSIYTSLEKEPPYRKGWLRLIKDICDYIKVNKGKKEVEEDEEESNWWLCVILEKNHVSHVRFPHAVSELKLKLGFKEGSFCCHFFEEVYALNLWTTHTVSLSCSMHTNCWLGMAWVEKMPGIHGAQFGYTFLIPTLLGGK